MLRTREFCFRKEVLLPFDNMVVLSVIFEWLRYFIIDMMHRSVSLINVVHLRNARNNFLTKNSSRGPCGPRKTGFESNFFTTVLG